MKVTFKDLSPEEILNWVEFKDADIQYDLFDPNKKLPQRRQEEGEDIRKLSIDLGVSDYFEFD